MTMISRMRRVAVLAVATGALAATAACGEDTAAGESPAQEPSAGPTATGDAGGPDDAVDGDRLYFYPPVSDAVLTISSDAGTPDSTVTVVGVDEGADGQTVRIRQEIPGADQIDIEAAFTAAGDGSLVLEFDMFLLGLTPLLEQAEEMTVTASGDDMVIPAIEDMESGATTEGEAVIEMSVEGFVLRNESAWTVRGSGYESVTTALGTFDAYVVDVDLSLESSMGPSAEGAIRYWFVPGFGWVRQQTTIDDISMTHEISASTVAP